MNALSKQLLSSLNECLDKADKSNVIIICSASQKAFCSGADLTERLSMDIYETEAFVDQLRKTFDRIARSDVISIACIEGLALGGGLELALACDLRVASLDAKLGLPETRLGIYPAAGGTQRLKNVVGIAKAKEMIFTGVPITANDALRIGLLNYSCQFPMEKAIEIASQIAANGPLAISEAKKAIDSGDSIKLGAGLLREKIGYQRLLNSSDRLEGLKSFVEKQAPRFKGR